MCRGSADLVREERILLSAESAQRLDRLPVRLHLVDIGAGKTAQRGQIPLALAAADVSAFELVKQIERYSVEHTRDDFLAAHAVLYQL